MISFKPFFLAALVQIVAAEVEVPVESQEIESQEDQQSGLPEGYSQEQMDKMMEEHIKMMEGIDPSMMGGAPKPPAKYLKEDQVNQMLFNAEVATTDLMTKEEMKKAVNQIRIDAAFKRSEQQFTKTDKNGDGEVSTDELMAVYRLDKDSEDRYMQVTIRMLMQVVDSVKAGEESTGLNQEQFSKVVNANLYQDLMVIVQDVDFDFRLSTSDPSTDSLVMTDFMAQSADQPKKEEEDAAAVEKREKAVTSEFNSMDTNKDGLVDRTELQARMGKDNQLESNVDKLFRTIDSNGDGLFDLTDELDDHIDTIRSDPFIYGLFPVQEKKQIVEEEMTEELEEEMTEELEEEIDEL